MQALAVLASASRYNDCWAACVALDACVSWSEAPYLRTESASRKQMSGRGFNILDDKVTKAKLALRRQQNRYLNLYKELQAAARKAKDLAVEVRRLKQGTRRASQRVASAKEAVRLRDLARRFRS